MLRRELVERLAARYSHLKRDQVQHFVSLALSQITKGLAAGHRVELRGVGIFSIQRRAARTARNPRTGASVAVAEKRLPFFKTGKDLHKRPNPTDQKDKRKAPSPNAADGLHRQ